MKKYWKLMLMAVGMSAAFTLASCNDDKDVVIDQIYYISTDPSATTYPTTFSVSLVDNSVAGRPFFYVVGKSTMRVDRNTTLRVEEDSKLVEKYNETYGKKYTITVFLRLWIRSSILMSSGARAAEAPGCTARLPSRTTCR